jgi:tRNA nucleotidyltransferase/poly(A) polymerase
LNAADLLADPALAPVLAALPNARLVGGPVRDLLAGLPIADIDLATPEPPEVTMAALQQAGLPVVPTGIAHGTVTAISNNRPFEITTLRRDLATDGRHATVAWTDDWQQDAARRDFTINAMSLDQAAQLHDYFGGADDLAAGRVRFVGDAAARVAEDYLRILRFFRFSARYGSGAPDPEAVDAIAAATGGLAILSAERVWHELKRVLAAPDPVDAVRLMARLGVLPAVLPEGTDPKRLAALVAAGAPPDPLLRLAALLTGDAATVAARLKFSVAEQTSLAALRHGPTPLPGDTDDTLRRLLAEEDAALLADRTWLAGGAGPTWDALRARVSALPRPVFPLEGRDALALGASPGPPVGVALRQVRDWWLAQGCTADRSSCMEMLRSALIWSRVT